MAAKANDVYAKIDALVTELGTASSHRRKLVQEIKDLETELAAIDTMLDAAADRTEYDEIMKARRECELDIKFARNRLRRFDQSPRIDHETLTDLMAQLSAEVDAAAKSYRQKVEKPLAQIVAAGDEFDATISRVCSAVQRLHSVQGSLVDRDETTRQAFSYLEPNKIRSRAYTDGTTVFPGLRDALGLATSAKMKPFDTN